MPTFAQTTVPVMSLTTSPAATQFANVNPAAQGGKAAAAGDKTFDELDIEVGGLKSRSDPALWGDGDGFEVGTGPSGAPEGTGSAQTFPVPPQHLADQRARAIALGLLPNVAVVSPSQQDATPPDAASSTAIHLYGKGKIIDFSEGTSFDPLRDNTYDLTTAKVVPAMKALPPLPPLASSGR